MTMNDSPWMNLHDAGAYVHRGRRFLRRQVDAGALRAAKIGGRGEILTRREWLDEWIEDQAQPVMVGRRSGFRG